MSTSYMQLQDEACNVGTEFWLLLQQVIVISFTLIITSMLATFAFVVNVGAVRFND